MDKRTDAVRADLYAGRELPSRRLASGLKRQAVSQGAQ